MLRECHRAQWMRRCLLLSVLGALVVLAGCSGSNQLAPGLAGSTADHPGTPPQVAAGGPGGTLAFVYDNQIWLRQGDKLRQVTHLVLSNGATIVWGPLVWSPGGRYIAFAVVEDLTPDVPRRTSGTLYYVDVGSGATFATPGIGSVYGHTYAWFTDRALIYSSSSDIMFYDLGDLDPRVWTLRDALTAPDGYTHSSGGNSFGDLAVAGDTLYYTRMGLDVGALGSGATVGTAEVRRLSLFPLSSDFRGTQFDNPNLPGIIANDSRQVQNNFADIAAPLGKVYSDSTGMPTAGQWRVAGDGSYVSAQQIDGVDTAKHVVSSHFCRINAFSTFCQPILKGIGRYPLTTHAALALSRQGKVAVTTDALYTQSVDGGNVGKAAASGWAVAPAWTGDGKHVLATQLTKTATDAGGVTRFSTDIVTFAGGQTSSVLIAGALNPAWK
ncbi:MAG TPA: hypothetical protein VFU88_06340 [Ktedonobacterales bacterium]|nr:hypothetical protein [Ktedonobacterales bacterium]